MNVTNILNENAESALEQALKHGDLIINKRTKRGKKISSLSYFNKYFNLLDLGVKSRPSRIVVPKYSSEPKQVNRNSAENIKKSENKIKRIISEYNEVSNKLKTLKNTEENKLKIKALQDIKNKLEPLQKEANKKNSYIKKYHKYLEDRKEGVIKKRTGNEDIINLALNQFVRNNKLPDTKLILKGTRIDSKNLSKLKRDEKMILPGIPPFKFEAKKYNPNQLLSKNGVTFAEIRRVSKDGEDKKAFNERIRKEFSVKKIAEMKKEISTIISKSENPYLLIGGNTIESIKVVYPNQYWLDVIINTSYSNNRIKIAAKAKKGININNFLTLTEFLKRMLVENNFTNFTKEILNG